jgi:hypothetical protein
MDANADAIDESQLFGDDDDEVLTTAEGVADVATVDGAIVVADDGAADAADDDDASVTSAGDSSVAGDEHAPVTITGLKRNHASGDIELLLDGDRVVHLPKRGRSGETPNERLLREAFFAVLRQCPVHVGDQGLVADVAAVAPPRALTVTHGRAPCYDSTDCVVGFRSWANMPDHYCARKSNECVEMDAAGVGCSIKMPTSVATGAPPHSITFPHGRQRTADGSTDWIVVNRKELGQFNVVCQLTLPSDNDSGSWGSFKPSELLSWTWSLYIVPDTMCPSQRALTSPEGDGSIFKRPETQASCTDRNKTSAVFFAAAGSANSGRLENYKDDKGDLFQRATAQPDANGTIKFCTMCFRKEFFTSVLKPQCVPGGRLRFYVSPAPGQHRGSIDAIRSKVSAWSPPFVVKANVVNTAIPRRDLKSNSSMASHTHHSVAKSSLT